MAGRLARQRGVGESRRARIVAGADSFHAVGSFGQLFIDGVAGAVAWIVRLRERGAGEQRRECRAEDETFHGNSPCFGFFVPSPRDNSATGRWVAIVAGGVPLRAKLACADRSGRPSRSPKRKTPAAGPGSLPRRLPLFAIFAGREV